MLASRKPQAVSKTVFAPSEDIELCLNRECINRTGRKVIVTQPDSNNIKSAPGTAESGLSDAEYKLDQVIGGRYRVLSLLGRGGMGVVYKVEQIYLGKQLALKTIDRTHITDVSIRRFQAEAKAAFAVDHPNIISVHDFGLLEDETPFFVMEIVEGETLASRIHRRVLTVDEAISIFTQVCLALAHAHEHGVVHRDVKPSNIMLLDQVPEGLEGSIKILDFGIAKLTQQGDAEIQSMTKTGEIFGSPLYMSPEQCMGGKVDHRSDVYSLGCVLFEALTSTTPFVGETALSTMMMHQSGVIPSLKEASLGSEFPGKLEQIVQVMLAKDPTNRYQSLREVANDLAAIKGGETSEFSAELEKTAFLPVPGLNSISIRRENFYLLLVGVALVSFFTTAVATYAFLATIPAPTVPSEKTQTFAPPEPTSFKTDIENGLCFSKNNGFADDNSMRVFKGYKGLQALDFAYCPVTDDGFKFLQDSKILKLILRHCNQIQSVDNIAKFSYLQDLNLSYSKIDDTAIPKLAALKMLRTLDISECNISDKGLLQLIPSTSLAWVLVTPHKYSKQTIEMLRRKMPACCFVPYEKSSIISEIPKAKEPADHYDRFAKIVAVAKQANPLSYAVSVNLEHMGAARLSQGKTEDAVNLLEKSLAVTKENGYLPSLATTLEWQASVAAKQHNLQKALELNNKAAQITFDTTLQYDASLPSAIMRLSIIPIAAKDFDSAIEFYKKGIRSMDLYAQQDRSLLPDFCEMVGRLYCLQKKPAEAIEYWDRFLDVSRTNKAKDPQAYARALIEDGELKSDRTLKRNMCLEGIQLMESQRLPDANYGREIYCDGCDTVAVLYSEDGKHAEAANYLHKALDAILTVATDANKVRRNSFSSKLVAQLKLLNRLQEATEISDKYGVK